MQHLFDLTFSRLDRAAAKRREFAHEWGAFIDRHPWDVDVVQLSPTRFEGLAIMREPAPAVLSLIFSEWLGMIRAALDNGLYAWAAALAGQDPPPAANSLQFPIAETPADFKAQARRLKSLPDSVTFVLEKCQPYHSAYGPRSNLLFWLNELARTDRHRKAHVGAGRVGQHKVRVGVPRGVTATFDKSVQPFQEISGSMVLCRFETDTPVERRLLTVDVRGVGIEPEISAWAGFEIDGVPKSLQDRMIYMELFMRNHLENMALMAGCEPLGGFKSFDPPRDDRGIAIPPTL